MVTMFGHLWKYFHQYVDQKFVVLQDFLQINAFQITAANYEEKLSEFYPQKDKKGTSCGFIFTRETLSFVL